MGITFDDEFTHVNFPIMKKNKIKESLIAILCASTFPLIYVIGRTIIWLFNHCVHV